MIKERIKTEKELVLYELKRKLKKEMALTKFWEEVEKKRKISTILSVVDNNYTALRKKCSDEEAYQKCIRACKNALSLDEAKSLIHEVIREEIECEESFCIRHTKVAETRIQLLDKMGFVAENNRLSQFSQSPYSESFYAYKKGEFIDWGEKPEGSLRLSDHWNFVTVDYETGEEEIHCVTDSTIEDCDLCLAIFKNGKYTRVA